MKEISKYNYSKQNKCICGKLISNNAKKCNSCERKLRYQIRHSPGYIDGRCSKSYYCIECGEEISYQTWRDGDRLCRSCANKGEKSNNYIDGRSINPKYCIDCNKQLKNYQATRCKSCANKLENHPNWKGGKSFEPYPLGWTKTFKEQIRFRDGYKCQICGCPEVECNRKLHVHHKDYDKENINPDNLISLCQSCHIKTNFNRKYWTEFFKEEIKC